MKTTFFSIRKHHHKKEFQSDLEEKNYSYDDEQLLRKPEIDGGMKSKLYGIGIDFKLGDVSEKKPAFSKRKLPEDNFLLAKSLNLGYYLVAPLLLGVFLGYWIDGILKTRPIFIVLLLGIGIVSSFYNLWKLTQE